MVKTIYTSVYRTSSDAVIGGGGAPVVEIHHIERHVHGNGIAIKVWGEMKVAGKDRVYAREMGLNTLQVLLLTTETGTHHLYHPQKWIYHKGEHNNYATIDIFGPGSGEIEYLAGSGNEARITDAALTLPTDGSIWLDFHAMGE